MDLHILLRAHHSFVITVFTDIRTLQGNNLWNAHADLWTKQLSFSMSLKKEICAATTWFKLLVPYLFREFASHPL